MNASRPGKPPPDLFYANGPERVIVVSADEDGGDRRGREPMKTKDANGGDRWVLPAIGAFMIIISVCALVVSGIIATRPTIHTSSRRARCASNLRHLAVAMNIYLGMYGGASGFPEPAEYFRGDEFLVILFWKGIVAEPRAFACPATTDTGPIDSLGSRIPMPNPALGSNWCRDDSVGDQHCSYAGRCQLPDGHAVEWRRTGHGTANVNHDFTEATMSTASVMACDKPGNHTTGVNVVYFDSRVEFIPDVNDYVGAEPSSIPGLASSDPDTRQLSQMDDGEP